MIYYRVTIQDSQPATWRWQSSPLTSLHPVLGLLNMYRGMPKERIRVFLSTVPEQLDKMLSLTNQGLLSTAVTVDQLWEKRCVNWIEVRRLEIELGTGGDHDCPYTWSLPPASSHVLAWTKLFARREWNERDS